MKKLTKVQNRVLSFIISYHERMGAPPTMREIADSLCYKSLNSVQQHLRLIANKGYIRLLRNRARGINIMNFSRQEDGDDRRNEERVPLVGTVPAGKPITAVENIDGYVTLDRTIFKGKGLFTLRVRGDSMKDIGVFDGDIVIVRQQSQANNGDVVVAIIDGEATLKRYFKEKDRVVLHAENTAFEDIVVKSDKDVWIVGKMVGVMRKC